MNKALDQAKICYKNGEVPVGAVIVRDGEIVSNGMNQRESKQDALGHAEIVAIDGACKKLKRWRLDGCTIYVTLEPCVMCAGAILNARIDRVVYGASDERLGATGSVANIFAMPFGHYPKITMGILEYECEDIIKEFFKNLRKK